MFQIIATDINYYGMSMCQSYTLYFYKDIDYFPSFSRQKNQSTLKLKLSEVAIQPTFVYTNMPYLKILCKNANLGSDNQTIKILLFYTDNYGIFSFGREEKNCGRCFGSLSLTNIMGCCAKVSPFYIFSSTSTIFQVFQDRKFDVPKKVV